MKLKVLKNKILCVILGHYGKIDTDKLLGTCKRCKWLFRVSYDMTYGETIWLEKINCGEYNCNVDKMYGFVPEAGCPLHD